MEKSQFSIQGQLFSKQNLWHVLTYIVCEQNHDVRPGRRSSLGREATAPQNSHSQEAQQRPFLHYQFQCWLSTVFSHWSAWAVPSAWVIYRTQRLVCVLYTFFFACFLLVVCCLFVCWLVRLFVCCLVGLFACLFVCLLSVCLLVSSFVCGGGVSMLSANSAAIWNTQVYVIYEVTRFSLISWMAPSVAWPTALTKQFIFVFGARLVTQMANTSPWLSNSCIFVLKWKEVFNMIIG